MEQFTNTVTAIRLDDTNTTRLGMLLDNVAERRELDARFGVRNCQVKTFSSRFNQANDIWVFGSRTDIVSFV